MGVYIYAYHFKDASKSYNTNIEEFIDEHISFLKSKGVNTIFLGGISVNNFRPFFKVLKKHNLPFIVEFDSAYFNPDWNNNEMTKHAIIAADFIKKYKNEYDIIAFSLKEEVKPQDTGRLCEYYREITKYYPEAKFQLLLNNINSAKILTEPYPVIIGADLYAFWFDVTYSKYVADPQYSLKWFTKKSSDFYKETARYNSKFMITATQGGLLMPKRANRIINSKDTLAEKAYQWAKDKEMGWSEFRDGNERNYIFWKYYRLPKNCMKALMWASVVQGAKSFFIWHYRPYLQSELNLTLEQAVKQFVKKHKDREYYDYWNLATKPLKPHPQLDEFAEAAEEIRPYENLIYELKKEEKSIIEINQNQIIHSTFSHPKENGRYVIIVNLNTGFMSSGTKNMKIDDEGYLLNYIAHEKPESIQFKLNKTQNSNVKVYDLEISKEVVDNHRVYSTHLNPGAGKIFFVGLSHEYKDVSKF